MTKSNYIKLFSIQIKHHFYVAQKDACLSVVPDQETDALFRRYGFKGSGFANEYSCYSDKGDKVADLLNYLTNGNGIVSFTFQLKTKSDLFYYITDISNNTSTRLFYTSNRIGAVNGNVKVLTPQVQSSSESIVGSVTVNFSDILPVNHDPKVFLLEFQSRTTQWNYYVVNRSNLKIKNPAVVGNEHFKFEGPEVIETPLGETALRFTSGQQLFPLSEQPLNKFDLVDIRNSEGETPARNAYKTIFKGLPNPNPRRFGIDRNGDREIYSSPIYVYL